MRLAYRSLVEKSCDFADTRCSVSKISVSTNGLDHSLPPDRLYPLDPHYALNTRSPYVFSSFFYLVEATWF
jgi:hypothetical protein